MKAWLAFGLAGLAFGSVNPDLLDAIAYVESSCNPAAIGDNGKAVGMYQLHTVYVDDVNTILKERRYTYEDRLDPEKSRQMVIIYLTHYGRHLSDLDKARVHNGGPRGHLKKATRSYAEKIRRALKQLKTKL